MDARSARWNGQRSSFPWEQEALEHIRAQVPDTEPYRAWQTFMFTASTGHVREVDLFIATPGGLYLVEVKSHPGRATNSGRTWLFRDGDVTRSTENPLHFTTGKAKELRSQLISAARSLKVTEKVPRVEAVVFLSAENLRCEFDDFQRPNVYGRDGKERQTTLDGIWTGCLGRPPRSDINRVTPSLSRQLPRLLQKIGIQGFTTIGRIGPYELGATSVDTGPSWEDYLAVNPSVPSDQPRRVRVYLSERGATEAERESVNRAAYREYRALQGVTHEGIVRAEQFSNELPSGPAVVLQHGKSWQRLDNFMTERGQELEPGTRREMVRQLAEALDYAHRRRLFHRGLAARCVWAELTPARCPTLRIADWQTAARPAGTSTVRPYTALASSAAHVEQSAAPYLAPEFDSPDAPSDLLDVFGLGAVSYLILTGHPPAGTRDQLLDRLHTDHALLLGETSALNQLVGHATAVSVADRTESVRQFLAELDLAEEELTKPKTGRNIDPLGAIPGQAINGWTVERILGKGSTARAFLVFTGDSKRVFKVALDEAADDRLRREAAQLAQLNDSHVARLLDPPFEWGEPNRTIIGVEYISGGTLTDDLRRYGRRNLRELESLGEDLFQAVRFLHSRDVWHRDIKPDNLALRRLPRGGVELVLLDFSLAGTPEAELSAGTRDYRDPFLGSGGRNRFDEAAELYAVAVTLHEMASGEVPSWGDGLMPQDLVDPGERAQLAADQFDPAARDGLVDFFTTALQPDTGLRFGSLHEMARAWLDIFRDLDTAPSPAALGEEPEDVRQAARERATLRTPLAEAGLSPRALAVAEHKLGVRTVGDLIQVPVRRITGLHGIGRMPQHELVRVCRAWRQRLEPAASISRSALRRSPAPAVVAGVTGVTRQELPETLRPLAQTRQRGGFAAVKVPARRAAEAAAALSSLDGVSPVNVSAEFARILREVAGEESETNFGALLEAAWQRLSARIHAVGGIVLLHDAAPLARYSGGLELLARLMVSARQPGPGIGQSPFGVWLLCPMADLARPPRLNDLPLDVDLGVGEQFTLFS